LLDESLAHIAGNPDAWFATRTEITAAYFAQTWNRYDRQRPARQRR